MKNAKNKDLTIIVVIVILFVIVFIAGLQLGIRKGRFLEDKLKKHHIKYEELCTW